MSDFGDTLIQALDEPERTLVADLIKADEAEEDEPNLEGKSQEQQKEIMKSAGEVALAKRAIAVTQAFQAYIEGKFTQYNITQD